MIFDGNFCPGDRALGQFLYKFDSKWRRGLIYFWYLIVFSGTVKYCVF